MTVVSYAQNFEDVILFRAFRDVSSGFYVDVGAQSPDRDSVTRLFYDRGWSGINIEPVSHWHAELAERRPRDVNIRAAAGAARGEVVIHHVENSGLSTTDADLGRRYAGEGRKVVEERVPCVTLNDVFSSRSIPVIHFLKIDVEGAEQAVLDGLDLRLHRPWILVIESSKPNERTETHEAWEPAVLASSYELVYHDGLNRYYLASERVDLREHFRFPPNVFDDFVRGTQETASLVERLDWYVAHLDRVQHLADQRGDALKHSSRQLDALNDISRQFNALKSASQRVMERFAPAFAIEGAEIPAQRRMFVDVTMLAMQDAGTGVQRVVRNILRSLLRLRQEDYRIEPVRFARGIGYLHAREFTAGFHPGFELSGVDDAEIAPAPGDRLLGLDLIADILPDELAYFRRLRDIGVEMWFVVYDLLPVQRPDFFAPDFRSIFARWYEAISLIAGGIACISQSVADDYKRWLDQIQPSRGKALQLGHFPLGSEMDDTAVSTTRAMPDRDHRRLLMVGTVEIRKGHGQMLDALELLWGRGLEVSLQVIGRPGWFSEQVIERLRTLSATDDHVTWLPAAADAELEKAYASAGALIMASMGEGYGLPIVEAACRGLPVIARNLPVFREIAGEGAFYFDGEDAASLADAIEAWMLLAVTGAEPSPGQIRRVTWDESAFQLVRLMEYGAQAQWLSDGEYAFDATHPAAATHVGKLEKGALVPTGQPGFLVYGPYMSLKRGDYEVVVELECGHASPVSAVMDIVASGSEIALFELNFAEIEFRPGRFSAIFPLSLDHDIAAFELRLQVGEGEGLRFLGATLTRTDRKDGYSRALHAERGLETAARQVAKTVEALRRTSAELEGALQESADANEHLAEAIAALRQAHAQHDGAMAEVGRLAAERAWWHERVVEMERSRSWRVTIPLRAAGHWARVGLRPAVRAIRPAWHRAVHIPGIARLALFLASPLPFLRARLVRSIAAHEETRITKTIDARPRGLHAHTDAATPASVAGLDDAVAGAYRTLIRLRRCEINRRPE